MDQKHPEIKIVVANICGALNSGDHTQLVSFLKILKEAFPNSAITCIHRNPELHCGLFPEIRWVEALGTAHAMSPIKRRIGNLRGIVPAVLGWHAILPHRQRETYKALRDADLIIAHPGGYFGNPGSSIYSAILHLILSPRARLLVISQSIGPFKSRFAKRVTQSVLSRAVLFTVREPCTYDYLIREMGFHPDQIHLFPDVAFFETEVDEQGTLEVLQGLGIHPQERIAATTFWPSSKLGIPESRYFEVLGSAARHLFKEHGIRTIALRQRGDAEGIEGDTPLLRQAAQHFGDAGIMAYEYYRPEVVRGIVRRCVVTYGTRMHANVFSLAQAVPTVAISYNHKTDGIMRMCGQERFVVDLRKLDLTSLVQRLELALAQEAEIRLSLKKIIAGFQLKRQELVRLIQTARSCS